MQLSNNNANSLLIDTHRAIEEYADFLVTKILDEKNFNFLTYPPNNGLTELEKGELQKLKNNLALKSALRKLIADNSAGVIFNLLNLLDGTTSPKDNSDHWTGVRLIDEEPNENLNPVDDMLHDKFYDTYWEWKKMRSNKKWKLDMLEE
jgi:hypothetical protein